MMLFNYARALKVPYLVQKLWKNVGFQKPKRLVGAGIFLVNLLISAVLFSFLIPVFDGAGIGYMLVYGAIPFGLTKVMLDVKTDGRALFVYVYDYVWFQWRFGLRHKQNTIEGIPVYAEQVVTFE